MRQFKFVAVGKLAERERKEHKGPPRNTRSTRKHRRDADWCDRDGSRSPSLCALGVPLRQFKFVAVRKLAARERKEHSIVRGFPLPSTGRGIEGEGWFGLRPLERDVCAHVRSHPSPRPSRAVLLAASPRSAVSRIFQPQKPPRTSKVLPAGSRRYSRLETCATRRTDFATKKSSHNVTM